MHCFRGLSIVAYGLLSLVACSSSEDPPDEPVLNSATVLDLNEVRTNPTAYEWFDFRPNVKKLILSGAAETEHVAILWYTIPDGGVGRHFHAKTESVYVIDGTQTDAKGVYPTGNLYFNPPGSGHEITDSTGFFLLAYASPPDFANTDSIEEYTPVHIDTEATDVTSANPFEQIENGVRLFTIPLDPAGGITAEFVEITSSEAYVHQGNYVLVLEGSCDIEGLTLGEDTLVVANAVEPKRYEVTAATNSSCLTMGLSF